MPLDATTATSVLARLGLAVDPAASVRELGGGVSNVVLAVDDRIVVKQARARLQVADRWEAKRERSVSEARALALAGELVPGRVPPVLGLDEDACILAIGYAPAGYRPWKDELLAGQADPAVAAELGRVTGTIHRLTATAEMARAFDDWQAFEQLRVAPYYRTLAARRPPFADAVADLIAAMERARACLVHGDLSPKNVLTAGGSDLWLIDFEVAHFGDPAFDVAFLLNHLLLKTIHRPAAAADYRSCAAAFRSHYGLAAGEVAAPADRTARHLALLLAARVDGKSPAEYLDDRTRAHARTLAESFVEDGVDDLDEPFARVIE